MKSFIETLKEVFREIVPVLFFGSLFTGLLVYIVDWYEAQKKLKELQGVEPYPIGTYVVCQTDWQNMGRFTWYVSDVRTNTKMIYVSSWFSAWVNNNQCESIITWE